MPWGKLFCRFWHCKRSIKGVALETIKTSKNPLYRGNTVWGVSPDWLTRQKSYVDKNKDKPINQVAVFKEKSGKWRWVTLSSSAFRDQDNEIVSTKALYNDVIRADLEKDYGTLRWWHVKNATLGDCDFNMLYGRTLIESGTFKNEAIAKAIKNVSDKLGVSIGFYHSINEPDREGVFHNIRRFERSLLPKEIASNPLTALVVKKKEIKNMVDDKKKIEVLREIVGDDLADEILAGAYHSEKEAIAQNIEFKAKKQAEEEIDEVMDEDEEEIAPPPGLSEEEEKCWWLNKKKPKKKKEDSDVEEDELEDELEEMVEGEKETVILKRPKKPAEEEQQPAQVKPAPPKPADYQRAESEPVAQRPAKAAIQVEEDKAPDKPTAEPPQVEKPAPAPAPKPEAQPAEDEGEYEEVEMEEVPLPEVIGNMTIEEFGELLASALSEALMPYLQTVKEARAELEKARLDFEVSTKEKDARESEVTTLKEKVSTLSNALEKAAEKIAGLEGDVPAVARPYVASQADDTILTEKDATLKSARPSEGESFVDWLAKT